jgi:hypothetical protein
MKVLLINGSARKQGNTFLALSEVAKTLEQQGVETEIVQIGTKAVRSCIACGQCMAKQLGRWVGPRMMLYAPKDALFHVFNKVKTWLQSLSFRTGVIVLLCCIPFYILSFAQMLLPISAAAKGILWTVLFGMAKTCQYGGLTILGVEGYNRLKNWMKRKED